MMPVQFFLKTENSLVFVADEIIKILDYKI